VSRWGRFLSAHMYLMAHKKIKNEPKGTDEPKGNVPNGSNERRNLKNGKN